MLGLEAHRTAAEAEIYLFILSWMYETQFALDLHQLEEAKREMHKGEFSRCRKRALKSGRTAVKNAKKVAEARTEAFRQMGVYYWLIGKQKKALSWWEKSISEGEQLGARPELSRTYFEVGKRLRETQNKHQTLNGMNSETYLEKAKMLFEEMDLTWDLAELERVLES